jgi:hypothetical protein
VRRAAVLLATGLLLAGLVVSRPLAWELVDTLPVGARGLRELPVLSRWPSDALQLYYQLWLARDGVLGPTPAFTDPYQFRTNGSRFNLPQAFLPLAVPFTILSIGGPHVAYNLLVLLSFPAAGLAAFALARRHGAGPLGAAVAGLVLAVAPARLGPLFGGQPAGFAAALLPLVVLGLDQAIAGGRRAGGLLGGAAWLALAMLEPHHAYLAGAFALAYAAARWRDPGSARPRTGPALGLFALGVLAGVAWLLLLRQTFLVGSVAEAGRSLDEVRTFSPGLRALAEPATYGGLGAAALALAGCGAAASGAPAGVRLVYAGAAATGLLLSLGPTVPGLPLYQALHRWAPLFALIRNPEKFRILVSLGVAVLAALGADAAVRRARRWPPRTRRTAGVALLAAVGLTTAPWHPIAVSRFRDSPVYQALRAEGGRALYLPVWPGDSAWSSLYLYGVTWTRVPMVNGYSPLVPRRYVEAVFEPLQALNVGDLGPAEHAALRRLGVTHVVVDRGAFPPQASPFPSALTLARLGASGALEPVRAADPLWLFRVADRTPAPPAPASSPVGLLFEAERLPRETGAPAGDARASGARIALARPAVDRPGFLAFGPYVPLPAGAYRAVFRLRGTGLTVEVAAERGRRHLARAAVAPAPAWTDAELPFTAAGGRPLEFRVHWDGTAEAAVDWVHVVTADRPEPEWAFEVEALPHRLGETRDLAASGGLAARADPVESLRGDLVSGPTRWYPAGRYRVVLRARAETATHGPLLRLAVTEPAGQRLAERLVDATELPPGAYREVALDFALERPQVVELPVGYLGDAPVLLDRLRVERW